jgi:hypothetical protein
MSLIETGIHLIIEERILQYSLNQRIGRTLEIEKLEKDFTVVKKELICPK